jgi:ATP-dependent DNA ligase
MSVTGRGRELFELMCSNDLEGIVAKRLADRYDTRVRWLKIKNPDYSQKEGRDESLQRDPAKSRKTRKREAGGSAAARRLADFPRRPIGYRLL